MTIQEAIKTEKPFKTPEGKAYYYPSTAEDRIITISTFNYEELLRDDWIVKEDWVEGASLKGICHHV